MSRLMARLRPWARRRTLVIFTSATAPWFEGSAGPFRDRKGGSAWNGSLPRALRGPLAGGCRRGRCRRPGPPLTCCRPLALPAAGCGG